MEILQYIGSDWFTHYIFNNSLGIPFTFYVILIGASISIIHLLLKKILW